METYPTPIDEMTEAQIDTELYERTVALETSIGKDSLYEFVKMAWHVVEPEQAFVYGKHIELLCNELEACYDGRQTRLIINVPPGSMKSLLCNVFFPAWVWTKNPAKRFICTSYAQNIAERDGKTCRKLVTSQWYQEHFDVKLSVDQQSKVNFENEAGGYRKSFGLGGGLTGEHADFIMIDDPIEIKNAESEAERVSANYVIDNVLPTRLNDPKNSCIILIMQRLHENDPTGHLLERGRWEHICLPMEYEGIPRFISSLGFKDWRTEVGELLWPERFGVNEVANLKKDLKSEYSIASQLQQRPSPLEGNIFLRKWFAERYTSQKIIAIYISIDTALSDSDEAARSAILVAGLTSQNKLIPLYIWKDKAKFPDLVDKILEISEKYSELLYSLIIEAKVSGISARQTLERLAPEWLRDENGNMKIVPFTPPANLKKDERARLASKWCENGMVVLPPNTDENSEWLPDFEKELFDAPNGRYMDMVDCLVQLIFVLEEVLSDGYLYGQN